MIYCPECSGIADPIPPYEGEGGRFFFRCRDCQTKVTEACGTVVLDLRQRNMELSKKLEDLKNVIKSKSSEE